jgi:hypothetical protein
MADLPQTFLKNRHHAAADRVKADLERDATFAAITPAETGERLRDCTAIWRRTVDTPEHSWVVDVGLPPLFPDEVPIAYLPAWKDVYLKNPHIGEDGFICTIPDSAAIDSDDPVGLVRYVFDDCRRILQGTDASDFQTEFSSYWNHSAPKGEQELVIIDPADRLLTPFPAVFSKNYIYVASSIDRINRWVSNKSGKVSDFKKDKNGVVIRLRAPLIPEDYPNTLAELVTLAENTDKEASRWIKAHLALASHNGLALLVQDEGDGVALGGIIFSGLGLSRINSTKLTHGFRLGAVPPDLLLKRAREQIKTSRVTRYPVERVDHQWIHSRGGDGQDLSDKSVVVIGCGSLGGYVAHLLSRSGIGKLTLTDNDVLVWNNLGRHVLGTSSIRNSKAKALALDLAQQMPHLEIMGIAKDWRDALSENPKLFTDKDLVVSTVAEWRCERPLNSLTRTVEMPPVLFGWVEPYAVAGHCLTVARDGGCFECGTNEFGQFLKAVAAFEKTPLAKEPGGCTYYQHYGPIALMPIASMIAAKVIECLLHLPPHSSLETWISNEEHFRSVQAVLTETWEISIQKAGYSHLYRTQWPKSNSCCICANRV